MELGTIENIATDYKSIRIRLIAAIRRDISSILASHGITGHVIFVTPVLIHYKHPGGDPNCARYRIYREHGVVAVHQWESSTWHRVHTVDRGVIADLLNLYYRAERALG